MNGSNMLRQAACVAVVASVGFLACSDDDSPMTPDNPGGTTGSLRGAVLDNGTSAPIAGAAVTVRVAGARVAGGGVITDGNGKFTLSDLAAGEVEIVVDARSILPTGNPDIHYTDIALHETVVAGETFDMSHPVFLPRIDESVATVIDGVNPATVSPPSIPGLTMDIAAAGATFPGGGTTGRVAIVEIPIDRAPMTMPPKTAPGLLISIQPAGTSFDPPAAIRFPNVEGLPAGFELDILSMDPVDGEFALSSRGRVTTDGMYIEPIPGTGNGGITAASWHAPICDPHTVTGRVVDDLGNPIAGATVEVLSGINSASGSSVVIDGGAAVSGADGTFSIPGVRVCNVRLRVSIATAGGAGLTQFDGPLADADGTTEVGDIELVVTDGLVSFNIVGMVRINDGSAAPGAVVQWFGGRGRGGVFDEADASGNYALNGIVSTPSSFFSMFASQEATNSFGSAAGTTPSLAENGTTLTIDLTICPKDQFEFTCPIGTWALSGNTLTISAPGAAGECFGVDVSGDIMITSLVSGALTIEITDKGTTDTITMVRVSGSGPTGVSAANLAGTYRQTDPLPPLDELRFVQLRANSNFSVLESSEGAGDFETGTYSLSGTALTVTPNYVSSGTVDPTETITAVVSGETLTISVTGEADEVFTRCSFSDGSSIEGMWYRDKGGFEFQYLMINQGEYVSGITGDQGRAGLSPEAAAFHAKALRATRLLPSTWVR